MKSYDVTASCRADPSRVHGLLVDGSTWPDWSPIDSYDVEPEAGAVDGDPASHAAQGRAVRVFRTGRNVARERVVELVPDRRLVYVMLSESSGLLRDYRGQIDVSPEAGGGTHIRWRATWSPPVPGVGWLMQVYLRGFQQRVVDGLARHADRDLRRDPGVDRPSR